MINVQRLDEIGSFRHQRLIEAIEGDLFCIRCNARLHQHITQPRALPTRIAHGAIAKLSSGNARITKAAAISRALVDGNNFHRLELLLQLGNREP